MKKQMRRDEINSLLFGLTDKSVEFRNKWRGVVSVAIWFVLSGFSMVLMILGSGAKGQLNIAVIIGMSFLKYIPLLIVVYNLARVMAARYLDDVYELDDEDLASDFLEEVIFGYGHEKITIHEGRISKKEEEESPLILIGGPGSIQVNLDSVALIEKVNGEPSVIYPRNDEWRLGRFERIREIGKHDEAGKREYAIINLRDQFVSDLSVRSRTKDGIPIEAQGIKVIFSILRRQQTEDDKVQGDAYLFDERAVRTLVYNQTIITPEPSTPSGITFPWDTTIIPLVISELEALIKSRTLSEILASIGQKEIDSVSSNEQTIARMRLEMTGQQTRVGMPKESVAPNFESRSKITAQFFDQKFKEKAARLGVSVEWIDIGTWQLPSALILDKHKEAWTLSHENAKKRSAVEHSKKRHEMVEILKLVNDVIIRNYEKTAVPQRLTEKEIEKLIETDPEFTTNPQYRRQIVRQENQKRDAATIALEMLNAFRKEIRAAKLLIENENRPLEEKQAELAKIEKTLYNISHLTTHWVRKPS
jgi:hypothetical protein